MYLPYDHRVLELVAGLQRIWKGGALLLVAVRVMYDLCRVGVQVIIALLIISILILILSYWFS